MHRCGEAAWYATSFSGQIIAISNELSGKMAQKGLYSRLGNSCWVNFPHCLSKSNAGRDCEVGVSLHARTGRVRVKQSIGSPDMATWIPDPRHCHAACSQGLEQRDLSVSIYSLLSCRDVSLGYMKSWQVTSPFKQTPATLNLIS